MPFSSSEPLQHILINLFHFIFLTLHCVFCLLYTCTSRLCSPCSVFLRLFHVFRNDLPLISFYAQKANLRRLARRKGQTRVAVVSKVKVKERNSVSKKEQAVVPAYQWCFFFLSRYLSVLSDRPQGDFSIGLASAGLEVV